MTSVAHAVDAVGLVKRWGGRTAVDGLDLHIPVGQVHGLVGPNGAGKTTVLRMLLGLVRPDAGTVRLFGRTREDVAAQGLHGVAGFVETPRFYPYLSGQRNLELLAVLDDNRAGERVAEVLDLVRLSSRASQRVSGFSLGMRQRLGLAAALLREPRLLVLDEPGNGLDPAGARDLHSVLRRLAAGGTTVLLSSHDLAEVEALSEEVTVLRAGVVAHRGSIEELRSRVPAAVHWLRTSADETALALASEHPEVVVAQHGGGGLALSGSVAAVDAYVVALGRADVAVRYLDQHTAALESLVLSSTASQDAADLVRR